MERMTDFENRLKALNEEFEEYKKTKQKLVAPVIGSTVEIAERKWIILDKAESGYMALAAESIGRKTFGSSNDWRESSLREFLNGEFLKEIEEKLGTALPEFERDLISLDGQTEYGGCMDKVSLITLDEYRKYREFIPNAGYWWWTCTPDSTKCNGDTAWIRVVSSGGVFNYYLFNYNLGVRPFCIFPSSLFESEES